MVMGCERRRYIIGESNRRLPDALGGHGSRVVALCYWGMQLQTARCLIMVGSSGHGLRVVAPWYWGMQGQMARRLITVV